MEEFDDLLNGGSKNTEIIQMLRYIADSGWTGLVVVEMRPGALQEKNKFGQISQQALLDAYGRIRQTLHNIFGK